MLEHDAKMSLPPNDPPRISDELRGEQIGQGLHESERGLAIELGRKAIEFHGTAILGISLMNGWFRNRNNLAGLLEWAAHNFKHIKLFIPDLFAEHNFIALGYDAQRSKEKARLQGNSLFNRFERLCSDFELNGVDVERINLKDIVACRSEYLISKNWIYDLYLTSEPFRIEARELTSQFLKGKLNDAERPDSTAVDADTSPKVDQAVHFLLEELAFLMAAPQIIGDPMCAYVYHKDMLILRKLIQGVYGEVPQSLRPCLGFVKFPGESRDGY